MPTKPKGKKAKVLDPSLPSYKRFNSPIIPPKVSYKFKEKDIFETKKKKGG